jgi:hypothetical protein
MQDWCTVCAERIIGSKIILDTPDGTNLVLDRLEIVLVSLQDRCTVCAKHTIGLEIIFDAPNVTPSHR